jgi:ATP-dependent Clp protease adaptor protein ClpS
MVKKENIRPAGNEKSEIQKQPVLILFNDDINSFDYVIECLVDICEHDEFQAEQCAFITHYKGKCDIKIGHGLELKIMKKQLIEKGLNVELQ